MKNAVPRSVVWSRADGSPSPHGVYQEGTDLVIRNPSAEHAGNYLCTITHPDGSVERFNVYLNHRAGTPAPDLGKLNKTNKRSTSFFYEILSII